MAKVARGNMSKMVFFRVLPAVFAAADKRAKADGLELSAILRQLLSDYASGKIEVERQPPIVTRRIEQ